MPAYNSDAIHGDNLDQLCIQGLYAYHRCSCPETGAKTRLMCCETVLSKVRVYSAATQRHTADASGLRESLAEECKLSGAPKAAGHFAETAPSTNLGKFMTCSQLPTQAYMHLMACSSSGSCLYSSDQYSALYRSSLVTSQPCPFLAASAHPSFLIMLMQVDCDNQISLYTPLFAADSGRGFADLSAIIEAKIMPGIPLEAQEQRVSNGIQSLLVAACLGKILVEGLLYPLLPAL